MKICHLILTHKNSQQLLRLAKAISHPNCDIYVHLDKKADVVDFEKIQKEVQCNFIRNRVKVNWGGYSIIDAIITSLNEIRASGKKYDFINFISGQDYPIRSMNEFVTFLSKNAGKCFIAFNRDDDKTWWKENIIRITRYHFNDFAIKGKYVFQRIANAILPLRKFPIQWKLYGGNYSCWWTISSDAADYFAATITQNKKLRRFAKLTWAPDEYLIATVLMNSQFKDRVVNNNYRYIDWTEKKASPKILTKEDISVFIKTDNFFARKFDIEVDADVLDYIDNQVLLLSQALQ